jgi:hypothetical protein
VAAQSRLEKLDATANPIRQRAPKRSLIDSYLVTNTMPLRRFRSAIHAEILDQLGPFPVKSWHNRVDNIRQLLRF